MHLDDVMIRRTSWHYYCPDAAERASEVTAWMAETLGWSAERQSAELSRYLPASAAVAAAGA
jgi:glycerol-3-phosphate dehydrogenase